MRASRKKPPYMWKVRMSARREMRQTSQDQEASATAQRSSVAHSLQGFSMTTTSGGSFTPQE
ncbi:hypothetical protein CRUP_035700 [Coryphaenoides rupestris]|nr:hypothetical protein CRUP_035700 [Coryphaenoides rupestris]